MAKIYTNNIADITAQFPNYVAENRLNPDADYPVRTETGTVPATPDSDGLYRIELDYVINASKAITVEVDGNAKTFVEYGVAVTASQYGGNLRGIPIIEFHSSLAGEPFEISYYPLASCRSSAWENKVEAELAEISVQAGTVTNDGAGNVTIGDSGDTVTIPGSLVVEGTTIEMNVETITVDDNMIVLNNNVTGAPTEHGGIEIERGTSSNATLIWNELYDKWQMGLTDDIYDIASETYVDGEITTVNSTITSHTSNTSNPHSVTKSQVGLSNVDNTSDANKPVSTATQTALNLKANLSGGNTFSGHQNVPSMTLTNSSSQLYAASAATVFDFDFDASTNASRNYRYARGINSGTGTISSLWYCGNASTDLAMSLNHKTKDLFVYNGIGCSGAVTSASATISGNLQANNIGVGGAASSRLVTLTGSFPELTFINTAASNKQWHMGGNSTSFSFTETSVGEVLRLNAGGGANVYGNLLTTGTITNNGMTISGSTFRPSSAGAIFARFVPNGSNRALFQAFNSDFSADSANYEVLEFGYDSSRTVAYVASLANGTGTVRNLNFQVGGSTPLQIGNLNKLGFFGTAPVSKPQVWDYFYTSSSGSPYSTPTAETLYTMYRQLLVGLENLGLITVLETY